METKFLTVLEFHARLNHALSLPTIHRMLRNGQIPGAVQPSGVGGKWLIPEDALSHVARSVVEVGN